MNAYPNIAGYTEPTTSKWAAEKIENSGRAKTIRHALEDLFAGGWKGTAENAAIAVSKSYRSVQPRISELRSQGKIESIGHTMGPEGVQITVWAAVQ